MEELNLYLTSIGHINCVFKNTGKIVNCRYNTYELLTLRGHLTITWVQHLILVRVHGNSRVPGFNTWFWWGFKATHEYLGSTLVFGEGSWELTSTWVQHRFLVRGHGNWRVPGFNTLVRVHVAHLFNAALCIFLFVSLRPVSGVPNDASVAGLSILDDPFEVL